MKPIEMVFKKLDLSRDDKTDLTFMGKEVIDEVRAFHKSFPQYECTPLRDLKHLAKHLGVASIMVKDESYRFGLNAFKVLGGAYAIGKYIASQLDVPISELPFQRLKSDEIKAVIGDVTFVTATDGNHGRGVAWAARELGQKAVVYMPKGSAEYRLNQILNEGAEASITELNYDDAVRLSDKTAKERGGVLVQDSSWPGYMDIPTWIMQGYATLMDEAIEQIETLGEQMPTHVFLQAGVGSFAGSMIGYLAARLGENKPVAVIVEPDEAACIFKSFKIGDGEPHHVTGFMPTMMAGLACGEPSLVAWGVLRDYAEVAVSCPDEVSAYGMRMLGNPLGDDEKVISGESGAVGVGLLGLLLSGNSEQRQLADQLGLDQNSRILFISTEGDTDPENYRKVVWEGINCLSK
ncbi:MAG TPA: diaminopropionate ammonia-lyase [Clostridiales bacterium UBA8960]|nr:diaminopropionate ammonia-lyase [Clostridiales bacterium UBA8960]